MKVKMQFEMIVILECLFNYKEVVAGRRGSAFWYSCT